MNSNLQLSVVLDKYSYYKTHLSSSPTKVCRAGRQAMTYVASIYVLFAFPKNQLINRSVPKVWPPRDSHAKVIVCKRGV